LASTLRRFRAVLVALAALAISAGGVFAARAMPPAAQTGLDRATEASGRAVPVGPAVEQAPVIEAPQATGEPGGEAPEADSHGTTVSEAAHAETPDGYRNHGAYVSEVARQNRGQERAAEVRSDKAKAATAAKSAKAAKAAKASRKG